MTTPRDEITRALALLRAGDPGEAAGVLESLLTWKALDPDPDPGAGVLPLCPNCMGAGGDCPMCEGSGRWAASETPADGALAIVWADEARGSRDLVTYTTEEAIAEALEALESLVGLPAAMDGAPDTVPGCRPMDACCECARCRFQEEHLQSSLLVAEEEIDAVRRGTEDPAWRRRGPWNLFGDDGRDTESVEVYWIR